MSVGPKTDTLYKIIVFKILGDAEHCLASVSEQCPAALNCYVAKALAVKYRITAHRTMHGIITAKMRFVTCEMLNSLEKIVMQRRACHGVVAHNGAISFTTTQLLWLLHTQPRSEHSQACIVLT